MFTDWRQMRNVRCYSAQRYSCESPQAHPHLVKHKLSLMFILDYCEKVRVLCDFFKVLSWYKWLHLRLLASHVFSLVRIQDSVSAQRPEHLFTA